MAGMGWEADRSYAEDGAREGGARAGGRGDPGHRAGFRASCKQASKQERDWCGHQRTRAGSFGDPAPFRGQARFARAEILVESLILAQDQRWRRA